MNNLKKSIMGKYNAEDVDSLLQKVRKDYENCLKEQKDRIIALRDENREMASTIEKYKNNEQYIINAITKAEVTAQSIISQAEQQARQRLSKAQREEHQIRMAANGCYERLQKLRRASESIYRAVSKVIGEHGESEASRISPLRPVTNITDRT